MSYKHLRMIRLLENHTKQEMADILGVELKVYSYLEKGIKDLTSNQKACLCKKFDMPLTFFETPFTTPYIISLHEE
jgi:DNA-binding XRE family transcriptional regulator